MEKDFYEEDEINEAEEIADEKKDKKKLPVIIIGGAIAIIFAVVAYWLLISAENTLLNKNNKTEVYILNTDLKKGTRLTTPSIFLKAKIDEDLVPVNAITDISTLQDTYILYDISKNTIITSDMF